MTKMLKICLSALLVAMLTFPMLAFAASNVTVSFDKTSKNTARVYLHGLGTSHTVRVDLRATDSSGNTVSWEGGNALATFQMAPWLKDAAAVAEDTYAQTDEVVVVISNGNNLLPTDESNTPDNYFIGTITTSGEDPIYVGVDEIQVTTGTTPDTIKPGADDPDGFLSFVELNTSTPVNPDNPDDPYNPSNTGNEGTSNGSRNPGNSVIRPNGSNSAKPSGGDLAKTGDENGILIGGLLIAVAVSGSAILVAVMSRKTRSKDQR